MDDSTGSVVLAELGEDLRRLWDALLGAQAGDLETAEESVRDDVLALGARLLAAGLAARGTGKAGARCACSCGGAATFEGYRAKGVQTVVGWITIRRAYYACATCGHGHCPLDAALGLARDSLSPGARRLAGHLGALLPFAEAARTLAATARVRLSASTVRTVTEAVGAQREAAVAAAITAAWALYEQIIFGDDAQVLTGSLLDYAIPRATWAPNIDVVLVEVPSQDGPFGAKGVGEPPIIPVPAAVANAIHDAVGIRVTELPMTPQRIFDQLRAEENA